ALFDEGSSTNSFEAAALPTNVHVGDELGSPPDAVKAVSSASAADALGIEPTQTWNTWVPAATMGAPSSPPLSLSPMKNASAAASHPARMRSVGRRSIQRRCLISFLLGGLG